MTFAGSLADARGEEDERLAEELLGAGFTSVRRYQLGMPVWRALGGLTEIRLEGVKYAHTP
jgi:hypothetical protein